MGRDTGHVRRRVGGLREGGDRGGRCVPGCWPELFHPHGGLGPRVDISLVCRERIERVGGDVGSGSGRGRGAGGRGVDIHLRVVAPMPHGNDLTVASLQKGYPARGVQRRGQVGADVETRGRRRRAVSRVFSLVCLRGERFTRACSNHRALEYQYAGDVEGTRVYEGHQSLIVGTASPPGGHAPPLLRSSSLPTAPLLPL